MSTLLAIIFGTIYLSKVVVLGLATVREGYARLFATRTRTRPADPAQV
jgi:hypothetical protein